MIEVQVGCKFFESVDEFHSNSLHRLVTEASYFTPVFSGMI
jgi:hypothetical protein